MHAIKAAMRHLRLSQRIAAFGSGPNDIDVSEPYGTKSPTAPRRLKGKNDDIINISIRDLG